ncbi:MAG: hypothetical protein JOZ88_01435, partial [Hyphomicrobiales bacterium]|nr:hypothetical protein [Hyphomicrobiales bacterium]
MSASISRIVESPRPPAKRRARLRTFTLRYWIIFVALACGAHAAKAESSSAHAKLCQMLMYGGADYVVCTVDLAQYALRMFLQDSEGKP